MGGKVLAAAGRGFLMTDATSPTAVILTFRESRQGGHSVSDKSIAVLCPWLSLRTLVIAALDVEDAVRTW